MVLRRRLQGAAEVLEQTGSDLKCGGSLPRGCRRGSGRDPAFFAKQGTGWGRTCPTAD
jgi:hypothetical protein